MAGSEAWRLRAAGMAALAGYGVHAGERVHAGAPEDLLWACNVGVVLIGLGLLGHDRRAGALSLAIGMCWLCFGTPLWLLAIGAGEPLIPSSALTHLGGPAVGLYGARHVDLPVGAWRTATWALLGLQGLCRLVTPAGANVNLVFAVSSGWEELFPSHALYFVMLTALGAATFRLCEAALRRVRRRGGQA